MAKNLIENIVQEKNLKSNRDSFEYFPDLVFFLIIFGCLMLYYVYRKGVGHGRKDELQRLTMALTELTEKFNGLQITPRHHVQIPVNKEGEFLHQLESGYVMKVIVKLEHRYIAERILGRGLAVNEVVHHIYPPARNNNRPENLCVLDRDDHDFFHTYVQREKELKGKWPLLEEQKILLKHRFRGILLEQALRGRYVRYPVIPPMKGGANDKGT